MRNEGLKYMPDEGSANMSTGIVAVATVKHAMLSPDTLRNRVNIAADGV
ncbi:MAG: hypothetical protein ACP5DZ_02215 [Bacteroidales bacterium]